jgi:predicted nucleic acid-binding protein
MTKLNDAFIGVTKLGFDTAPLIYFVERNPKYVDLVREVVRRVDVGQISGFSSMVALTEVLTKPKKVGDTKTEDEYRDLLLHSRNFRLILIDSTVAERAADLRARYNLRTPDALQIAAALETGCQAFLTNDIQLKRVIELRVLILDELEL